GGDRAMKRFGLIVGALLIAATLGINSQAAITQKKISKERAQEIALQRAPGKVESSELEREHGKLVYSFDIRKDKGVITEVQVDPKTGKIISVEEESAEQEKAGRRKKEKGKHNEAHPPHQKKNQQ